MVDEPERAPNAMIAYANEIASRGGNAIHAAVAVAFALAVVHPEGY